MSLLGSILDSLFATPRRGSVSCRCGTVQLELVVPGSSYGFVEQTTALCHCRDCVGFCQRCGSLDGGEAPPMLTENKASDMVQFYKSDVTVVAGRDRLGAVRLHKGSHMIRCYCQNCGTPLGAEIIAPAPVLLLYRDMLWDYDIVFLPKLVLNMASALPRSRSYDRCTTVRQGLFAPVFLLRVLARVVLGLLFGKGQGGLLEGEYANIPVGLDKVVITPSNPKKMQ